MNREYSVPSHMTLDQAQAAIAGVLEPFTFMAFQQHPSRRTIEVQADAPALEVCAGAIRFLLHEPKGCTCAPCQYRAEVMR